jgi:hypothetical protein
MSEFFNDSLIADFIAEVAWSEENDLVQYRALDSDSFVLLGGMCGESSEGVPNSRNWDEYLPFLMEAFCQDIELAKGLETARTHGGCIAALLGGLSGQIGAPSKAELIGRLSQK